MTLKYSRQRETIKDFLSNRNDHPTADMVYINVRKSYPNISLGTVYRNLTLLADIGEIARLRVGDGADHFDADTSPHYHFICQRCGGIEDLEMVQASNMASKAMECFDGQIDGFVAYFYGKCSSCLKDSPG